MEVKCAQQPVETHVNEQELLVLWHKHPKLCSSQFGTERRGMSLEGKKKTLYELVGLLSLIHI